jgi:sterol desaturase/sphingolipid hydroxylase (fatty acid hydroxylase superfamily)
MESILQAFQALPVERLITVSLQGGAIGLFLLAGVLWPRRNESVFIRDTVVNIATGVVLYAFRLVIAFLLERADIAEGLGVVDLSVVSSPWVQLLIAFVVLDLGRYFVHWLDHRVPFLWTFHRVHHSSEALNATAGLRMHMIDLVQLTMIPLVLFSLVFDVSALSHGWVLPAAMSFGIVSDAFQHANLRFPIQHPLGRAWNLLLNNPHFHCWHHTRDGVKKDGNYGNVLTVWDRLFGTDVTEPEPPAAFGLTVDQALETSIVGLQRLKRRVA